MKLKMSNSAPSTPKSKHKRKFSMGSYSANKENKEREKRKKEHGQRRSEIITDSKFPSRFKSPPRFNRTLSETVFESKSISPTTATASKNASNNRHSLHLPIGEPNRQQPSLGLGHESRQVAVRQVSSVGEYRTAVGEQRQMNGQKSHSRNLSVGYVGDYGVTEAKPFYLHSQLEAYMDLVRNRGGRGGGGRRQLSQKRQEDESDEDSVESEQTNSEESINKTSPSKPQKSREKRSRDWEIVEGLRDGQTCEQKPDKAEGYMMKRRKWPMKGWHKRFFVLENGILTYAKSSADTLKGKYHGTVDIGLSFITYKKERRRIDIDAEDLIYHIKVKSCNSFDDWIQRFRHHRFYRQHEIAFGTKDAPKLTDVTTPVDEFSTPITSPVQSGVTNAFSSERTINRGSFKLRTMDRAQSKVTAWLLDSSGMESTQKDLTATQAKIFELGNLLERLQSIQVTNGHSDASLDSPDHLSSNGPQSTTSSEKEKSRRMRGLKFRNKDYKKSQERLTVPNGSDKSIHQSLSNPSLISMDGGKVRPVSLPDTLITQGQEAFMREEFLNNAKGIHVQLKHLSRTIMTERERLKQAFCASSAPMSMNTNQTAYVDALKNALSGALKQNEDYKGRLARINADSSITSSIGSPTMVPSAQDRLNNTLGRDVKPPEHPLLLSNSASWESQSVQSVSEFYDAEEYHLSSEDSSEEEEEEEEISSDISDTENTVVPTPDEDGLHKQSLTGRRNILPVPRPEDANVSLWGLLRKNIGKDLSKISMPVTLNEPLSLLQRLCEELEYSDLLDKVSEVDDPYQRMLYIAAFSVSSYAATVYRAGQKPFNPLLGETFECIREDKGWRFIAEQVSHHPPISTCYCESKNFLFWQDIRLKTKFWGKSMEIQPQGSVHVTLPKYKDHYVWNKPTTCVHNLLGGSRWVDHYGEINLENKSNGIVCKLTYAKSSYWSSNRHEIYGSVISPDGKVVHNIFGKWNEGIYYGAHPSSAKCMWRPGSMAEDYDLYYGFTRFAIELNEIEQDQCHLYAPTDTRFRPDQRLLEEGRITEAETEKHRIETMQRERRKKIEGEKSQYCAKWFMKTENDGQEIYMYTGKYFELRKDPSFSRIKFDKLW